MAMYLMTWVVVVVMVLYCLIVTTFSLNELNVFIYLLSCEGLMTCRKSELVELGRFILLNFISSHSAL